MNQPPVTADGRFADLVETFRDRPGVDFDGTGKKAFGSSALKVGGKIFAMLVGGRLVVKLPRGRVDALVAASNGERFVPGHGRVMKEWLAVAPTSDLDWPTLADEALAFVGSAR